MKNLPFLAIACLFSAATTAISLGPPSSSPRVVGLNIKRKQITHPLNHDRSKRKRSGALTETLDNEGTLYFASVTLGTPPQTLELQIDTGSSDLWVNVPNSALCESRRSGCGASGTYDSTLSSTYKFVDNQFNISYEDGSGAAGNYVTDTLTIGGQVLDNFQFGLGDVSSNVEGVLGIGYTSIEVQVNRLGQSPYPNLPQAMVDAKLITTNAYSLWLNDLSANEGQILFGGVNTAKYQGTLESLPLVKIGGGYNEFLIALTDVSFTTDSSTISFSSSSSLPAAVLLDSGSSLLYLPDDLTDDIYNVVNAVYDQRSGTAYVPCSLANNDSTIDFTFSAPKISIPFSELVLDAATSYNGSPLTFQNGEAACVFGIAPAGDDGVIVFGDTFLRSAYVVYDLDNNEISLAQTNFNSTNDDIREINAGANGVPGATLVPSAVTNVAAQTGGAILGGAPTGGVTTATALPGGAVHTEIPLALAAGGLVAAIMLTL